MTSKFHEELHRHAAVLADGREVELLERLTFERSVQPDGSLSQARQVNQRFDLRTGERVRHLGGDEFVLDLGGESLQRRS
jgi:hypothetical protein